VECRELGRGFSSIYFLITSMNFNRLSVIVALFFFIFLGFYLYLTPAFVADDFSSSLQNSPHKPPVVSEPTTRAFDGCVITGCSSHLCSEEEVATTCEFQEAYRCFDSAICERQDDGKCDWSESERIARCLETYEPVRFPTELEPDLL